MKTSNTTTINYAKEKIKTPSFTSPQIAAIKNSPAGVTPPALPPMDKTLLKKITDSKVGQIPSGLSLPPSVTDKVPFYQRPTAEQRKKGIRF